MAKVPERAARAIYQLFGSEVIEPLVADQRTNMKAKPSVYFGCSSPEIIKSLQSGRADFSYGDTLFGGRKITADERVLCYCHFNMKGHLFAARENFKSRQEWLANIFKAASRVVFIDIGCGPGTAGLAFAECFPRMAFKYYGVDAAEPMQKKCRSMMSAAKAKLLVPLGTTVTCKSSWDDVPTDFGSKSAIVLNFSFFFASDSLEDADLDSLVAFHNELVAKNPNSNVLISYTNSIDPRAAKNYKKFIQKLDIVYDAQPPLQKKIKYFIKVSDMATNDTEFCHEVFEVEV